MRVIERGEHARFALEAGEPIGMRRELARQDLDRDVASEPRIARAVDLAHAARADLGQHVIGADAPARQRRGADVAHQTGSGRDGAAPQRIVGRDVMRQQGLDLVPEGVIARAGLRQER